MLISDKQHPFLTPLPFLTIFVSPWSNHIVTLCFIYSLLIGFLSHQSMFVSFRICINLVQVVYIVRCSLLVCEQAHNSSLMSQVCSYIILSFSTSQLTMGWMVCGWNSGMGEIFPNGPDWKPKSHTTSCTVGTPGLCLRGKFIRARC
jgi:hypothetical protein